MKLAHVRCALVSKAALPVSMVLGFASISHARPWNWTAVNLHPTGATQSIGWGAGKDWQVGQVSFGDSTHAALWHASPETWVDLHPGSAGASAAGACTATHQVGFIDATSNAKHAALWNGTAQSLVDLHPAGASASTVFDLTGDTQVGAALFGSDWHAGRWTGTAGSWFDLHPGVASMSMIVASDGVQQVGYATVNFKKRASLWMGTPESWVDLTPSGASDGVVHDVDAGWQVGFAYIELAKRAGFWNGTASSWVNRHWPGATESIAYGIDGQFMVGSATVNGLEQAVVWDLAGNQDFILHNAVQGSWAKTVAHGISRDENFVYVIGTGYNLDTQRYEALLWIGEGNAPCYNECNGDGSLNVDDFICFMTYYSLGDPYADCDVNGVLNNDDWICWQTFFVIGC